MEPIEFFGAFGLGAVAVWLTGTRAGKNAIKRVCKAGMALSEQTAKFKENVRGAVAEAKQEMETAARVAEDVAEVAEVVEL